MNSECIYNDFPTFLRRFFTCKVQKISLNAGFTCPNRDGTVGYGGCTYCNNQTFSPDYCHSKRSVSQQLKEGKLFFAHKYPDMKYLAYFQAYTNTYADQDKLKQLYEEALSVDGVVGIVIGTRPDTVSDRLLDYLADLSRQTFVLIEYGIESALDSTLIRINRGHNWQTTVDALERTASRGLLTGGHVILGLPGESRENILEQTSAISSLPLHTLKLHQLQLIRGTRMAQEYIIRPEDFHLYEDVNEYIDLVIDYIQRLRPNIVLERFVSQSPRELLIGPDWRMKNYEFLHRLQKRMKEREAYQGKLYRIP